MIRKNLIQGSSQSSYSRSIIFRIGVNFCSGFIINIFKSSTWEGFSETPLHDSSRTSIRISQEICSVFFSNPLQDFSKTLLTPSSFKFFFKNSEMETYQQKSYEKFRKPVQERHSLQYSTRKLFRYLSESWLGFITNPEDDCSRMLMNIPH